MPLRSNYYEDDGNGGPEPPPRPAPPPPAGGGTNPPTQAPPPPQAPPSGPSGGGGASGPWMPPVWGGFNAPGAPAFTYRPYVAPDAHALLNDPGYLARLGAGQMAMDRSAAAKGMVRTGGQLADLDKYGQDLAAGEYKAANDRALQEYDRYYQGQRDAYAPIFARWQMNADAAKQAALGGYNAQISHELQASAPHYDPGPNLEELMGPPPTIPGYNGGDGGYQAYGDPWTGNERYRMQGDPWTGNERFYY